VSGSCLALATKTIFVTSATYDGSTIGSLGHADMLCQGLATASGLGGMYKAFLSDDTTDAVARLTHATVPYTLVDGTIVATNWTNLTSGAAMSPINLLAAVNMTEAGGPAPAGTFPMGNGNVFTGSFGDGTRGPGLTCNNWMSSDPGDSAFTGDSPSVDLGWLSFSIETCDLLGALYCVQQ
jgi:hypothetical protein